MNSSKKVFKEIQILELKAGKKRYESLPMIYFLIGISISFFLNITANIVYETIKNSFIFKTIYSVSTFIILYLIVHSINKIYVEPIKDIEKKIIKKQKLIKNDK